MKKWILFISVSALGVVLMFGLSCQSYEAAYERTPSGSVILKTIPAKKALVSENAGGEYFESANSLFRKNFKYINSHNVSMTVPVETRMEPAQMKFFVGETDRDKELANTDTVSIVSVPERNVISVGITGSYSKANYDAGVKILQEWLENHKDEYQPVGEPFAAYWNSPFVPWFMRKSEVNWEVRTVSSQK